jgi:uncharacterized membrane protein YeaQ/YmgE (transglycosylase-associated protein family)
MVSWFKTVIVGLIIAVIGGILATLTNSTQNTTNYSSILWGVCLVGVALIILGIVTKVKHLSGD